MITYKESTPKLLTQSWDAEIAANTGDNRYIVWKKRFMRENANGVCKTFFVFDGKKIIGQATLVFDSKSEELNGRIELANNKDTANIAALRIDKKYEGKGIVSGLMKFVSGWARANGLNFLTIGVEPHQVRNMQIYFHWGFVEYITFAIEKYQ